VRSKQAFFVAGALTFIVGVTACGDNETTAKSGFDLPSLDEVPIDQRVALQDGLVTADEYQAGFAAFQKCVEEDNGNLTDVVVDPETGERSYQSTGAIGTPDEPNLGSATGRCHNQYFSWIEIAYSVGNPDVLAVLERRADEEFVNLLKPCLEANGRDVPSTRPPTDSDEYSRLLDEYTGLTASGSCPSTTNP